MASPATPNASPQVLQPLTKRNAWKSLQSHYEKVRDVHLRKLFADDPKRFARRQIEADMPQDWLRVPELGDRA